MLDIVIVNWNSGERLRAVVTSIAEHHEGLVGSAVVVDNASVDDSLDLVENISTDLPFDLRVIKNSSNVGFAVACNQGARFGNAEHILFLNPDTRVFEHSLDRPLGFLGRPANQRVGIVGIQLVDEEGHVARSCARFPSLLRFLVQALGIHRLMGLRKLSQAMTEWNHDETRPVDQVIGAFFLVRRKLFETLGGFDERFFVYFEEVDFARRALDCGWSSVYLVDAQAFHEGGGTSRQVKPHRLFYSLRSRLLYGFKHFRRWEAWLLVLVTLVVEPVSRMAFCLASGGGIRDTFRGYGMLYRALPEIISGSRRS